MPHLSKKTEATLAEIAAKNGVTKEEVINYIGDILDGKKVSKHSHLLTGKAKNFSCPSGV